MKKIIYVGKAKNLRKRLQSYFTSSSLSRNNLKNRSLIQQIFGFEVFKTKSEKEALILEDNFVKKYQPKYNILLRDDKRFLLIRLDLSNPFPYPELVRFKRKDNCLYFGPFPHGSVLKQTLDYLVKFFNLRSCKVENPSLKDKHHCHDYIIRFCSSPCDRSITEEKYKEKINSFIETLRGKNRDIIQSLNEKMIDYSQKMNYEKAGELRDIITNIKFLFLERTRQVNKNLEQPLLDKDRLLLDMKKTLKLKCIPKKIECFDNSHFQGSFLVSSVVQFFNGSPNKKAYRRFKIKFVDKGNNDFQSMFEVVFRRYKRLLEEDKELPHLVLVDGGKGQLSYAGYALKALGLEKKINLFSLAKNQEIIYSQFFSKGLKLEETSPVHKLFRFIRDEAHRFSLAFHQHLRNKQMKNSILDKIPSIGEKRRYALLNAFASVDIIKKQSVQSLIKKVPNIGKKQAEAVLKYLNERLL